MKIAVMQPYIFAYIGYFQMIKAVDKFVFYDDVSFIKQGWVNRNRILVNGKDFLFSVPQEKISSYTQIKDSLISKKNYEVWKNKFLQTLEQSYKKSPHYDLVITLIVSVLNKNFSTISELAIDSAISISKYLGLITKFIISSEKYKNQEMERAARLIDICKQEGADEYLNAIGGMELYSKEEFEEQGIKLNFIKSQPIEYKQFKNEFVPWLSIIDVLMFNSVEEINEMLDGYNLI